MEALIKSQKWAKNIMSAFVVVLLLSPVVLYYYMTTTKYQVVFFVLLQVCFILFCLFGATGGYMTAKIVGKLEDDMLEKLKKNQPLLKFKRVGYSLYQVEESVKGIYLSKGDFKIDTNSIPSSQVEINFDKKVIAYK